MKGGIKRKIIEESGNNPPYDEQEQEQQEQQEQQQQEQEQQEQQEKYDFFMKNSQIRLLTDGSLYGVILECTIKKEIESQSPFRSFRLKTQDNINKIILKFVLINDIEMGDRSWLYSSDKKKEFMNTAEFENENKTQREIIIKTLKYLEPICPILLFFSVIEYDMNLSICDLLQSYTNNCDNSAKTAITNIKTYLMNADASKIKNISLGIICMESIQGKTLGEIKLSTIMITDNNYYNTHEFYRYCQMAILELFQLVLLGYNHGDYHMNNIIIETDYTEYYSNYENKSINGRGLWIDFGRTTLLTNQIGENNTNILIKNIEYLLSENNNQTLKGKTNLFISICQYFIGIIKPRKIHTHIYTEEQEIIFEKKKTQFYFIYGWIYNFIFKKKIQNLQNPTQFSYEYFMEEYTMDFVNDLIELNTLREKTKKKLLDEMGTTIIGGNVNPQTNHQHPANIWKLKLEKHLNSLKLQKFIYDKNNIIIKKNNEENKTEKTTTEEETVVAFHLTKEENNKINFYSSSNKNIKNILEKEKIESKPVLQLQLQKLIQQQQGGNKNNKKRKTNNKKRKTNNKKRKTNNRKSTKKTKVIF